jgi:hypothetical protein
MAYRPTFKEYLEQSSEKLTRRLIEKAYVANKLAKITSGESKWRLYCLKYQYLSSAMKLKPTWFCVDSQKRLGDSILLGVTTLPGFAFHVPAHRLTNGAYSTAQQRTEGAMETIHAQKTLASN